MTSFFIVKIDVDGYPTLFSMRIHHGGYFTDLPGRSYVNGKENIVDVSDIEEFSVYEVDSIMKQLGYNETVEPIYYHFLIPGKDLDVGLEALGNEDDVLNFSKYVANHKLIELYTEHGVTKLNTYFMSPKTNRLTMEEIIDEVRQDDDLIVDLDNAHNEPDITVSLFSLNSHAQIGGNINLIPDELVVEDDIDVINNDSFDSASDSEDDLERIRRRKLRQLEKEKKVDEGVMNMYEFYCGQKFGSSKEVKDRIYKHSIETRRELKMSKNDKVRVTAICVGKIPICSSSDGSGPSQCVGPNNNESGPSARTKVNNSELKETEFVAKGKGRRVKYVENICPWRLYVAKENGSETWVVKTLVEEHKCLQSRNIKAATSTFYSTHITDQIVVNPNIPIKAVQDQLQKQFALGVSKMKAFRAKTKADVQVKGDYKLQYAMLRDYILELQTTNANTTVRIEVEREPDHRNPTRVFKRIYVCLGAMKEGYRACQRELLGLDGAFMKGPFPGQVLTAVGIDPNNGIYPLAYAIVDAENKDSWTWFLQCLGDDLNLEANSNFTFISDRQKVITYSIVNFFKMFIFF